MLESAYEECNAHEYVLRQLPYERQKQIPVITKGVRLDCGFRIDFLVGDSAIVELKAVEKLLPIHQAQVITYLKLTGCKLGLLLNFNVPRMREGTQRVALNL